MTLSQYAQLSSMYSTAACLFFPLCQGHNLCCILGKKKTTLWMCSWLCLDLKAQRLLLLLVVLMSRSVIFTEITRYPRSQRSKTLLRDSVQRTGATFSLICRIFLNRNEEDPCAFVCVFFSWPKEVAHPQSYAAQFVCAAV